MESSMLNHVYKRVSQIAVLFCVCFGTTVHAKSWVICDARINISAHGKNELSAKVVDTSQTNPPSCFKSGELLQFEPETADYQQVLPKKAWPKPGQHVRLRYRELNGVCKGDGLDKPCTIRHYSIMK